MGGCIDCVCLLFGNETFGCLKLKKVLIDIFEKSQKNRWMLSHSSNYHLDVLLIFTIFV